MTKSKEIYYSLDKILKCKADYNIVFGERSNGKTYATLEYSIRQFLKDGSQFAYIRRWREDLRGKRASTLFNSHLELINKLSNNTWDNVIYNQGKWYLAKGKETSEPIGFNFALSEQEHEKSTSYPNIKTIIFDEFLTRRYYLPDEFLLFTNLLSTIIRKRDNVIIFMLGNTVNKYNPYFTEMGLTNAVNQKQGTIDVYTFGQTKIAVEYAESLSNGKESNKYFCFDNPNLQMITEGKWELSIYPHLPTKYTPKNILFKFYIIFNDNVLQGNIINVDNSLFIYIHTKTTEIKDKENALIYQLEPSNKFNVKRKLLSTLSDIEKKITKFFATDKVFYQNNEVGEIVRNYIKLSNVNNILS